MSDNNKNGSKKTHKHFLYNLFNPSGNGKGVSPEEARMPRNFVNFFKFLSRNITNILMVNIMLIFGNFPIFFAIIAGAGYFNIYSYAPSSPLFGPIFGAAKFLEASPAKSVLLGTLLTQISMSRTTPATIVFYCLTALMLFTFGPVRSGATAVMRNMVRGEPVFLWDDFKKSLVSNLKQSIIIGIIDLLLLFALAFDIMFFIVSGMSLALGVLIVLAFIYIIMRSYIYTIMITFDLSIFKIFKNSFILALAGMKRNLPAFLGIAAVIVLNVYVVLTFAPLGFIMMLVLTFSLCIFIGIYGAYPKIKEVMIDPYYESDSPNAKPKRVKKSELSESKGENNESSDNIVNEEKNEEENDKETPENNEN